MPLSFFGPSQNIVQPSGLVSFNTGKISNDPDLTAYWDFTRGTLDPVDGLGPTLDFVRNSEATYVGLNGNIRTAAINEPRFEYTAGHSPLGFLSEGTRTNQMRASEKFEDAVWNNPAGTVTDDVEISPDGTLNATVWLADAGSQPPQIFAVDPGRFTQTIGEEWTETLFAKAVTHEFIQLLYFTAPFDADAFVNFNVLTGEVGATAAGVTASSELMANGFYRISITATATATGEGGFFAVMVENLNSGRVESWSPTGAETLIIWGADEQIGAFPTSYIKTDTSSVTRASDFYSTTDLSWYNEPAGTYFAQYSATHEGSVEGGLFDVSDGTAGTRIRLQALALTTRTSFISSGGTVLSLTSAVDAGLNTTIKACGYAQLNDAEFYVQGVRTGTGDQTLTMPAGMTTMIVSNRTDGVRSLIGHMQQIRYYNVVKSQQFLEDVTRP